MPSLPNPNPAPILPPPPPPPDRITNPSVRLETRLALSMCQSKQFAWASCYCRRIAKTCLHISFLLLLAVNTLYVSLSNFLPGALKSFQSHSNAAETLPIIFAWRHLANSILLNSIFFCHTYNLVLCWRRFSSLSICIYLNFILNI